MKQTQDNVRYSVAALRDEILNGKWGPSPDSLPVTGASSIYQTTQFPSSATKYHNYYLLLRSEAYFGACSHTADQLDAGAAGQLSGLTLDAALRDERLPVQIAAMDAYLGVVRPHAELCGKAVEVAAGTPIQKANRRDALIADMAGITPGQTVALIGVVNPLVAAIKERGGACLPCDLHLETTQWGDAVEQDMEKVLERADNVICTAMTLGNGTFDRILERVRERRIPLTVYAQTGSAIVASFLGKGVTKLLAEPFPFTQFSADATRLYSYG
ncbi:MAG: hypothetical protein K0Q59_5216 [Paenibacillus sp.]|jgi:hypothetical protein|nr:hypothetical protein [Paenibacillus sp.]